MTAPTVTDPVEALAERIFSEGIGAFHLLTVYLGVRLGLFRALAETPALTAAGLAAAASIDERYAVEWLQAETYAGLLVADGTDYTTARFTLAEGVAPTLVDEVSPAYVGGVPLALVAVAGAAPHLLDAYRNGAGLTVDAYGADMVPAQAAFNRPAYVNELATSWLPSMPDVHERLIDTTTPARVADIGCGCGWSAIELAKAFDHLTIDGYDADAESVEQARRNAAEHGVDDRVHFHLVDASSATYGAGGYDVVFFFECVHDLGRPVEALAAARAALARDLHGGAGPAARDARDQGRRQRRRDQGLRRRQAGDLEGGDVAAAGARRLQRRDE